MGEEAVMIEAGVRVLLVEPDDSTRQIIAALLRKCSYTVAAAPDGLRAWETLKERPHNIDLVLTEIELPSISGYALLTLIVEHDMCKNIPVIMMSSKDSIHTVLKCMIKGAADFLVKPVRKNELRNLWQHVWRKRIQSAGTRPQNKALENQKTLEVSEKDTASNYSSDNLASVQRRDDASHTQGITDVRCRDTSNTCNDERHEECVEMVEKSFLPNSKPLANKTNSVKGTSSGIGPYINFAVSSEKDTPLFEPRGMSNELQHGCHSNNTCPVDEVDFQFNGLHSAPCTEAFDLIGIFENCLPERDGHSYDGKDSNVSSRLGLTLRTFNPSCSNDEGYTEQNLLSYSKASAFSKYDNKKALLNNSATLKEGFSASTWEPDALLAESHQNMTTPVMHQPGSCRAGISGTQLSFTPVDNMMVGSMAADDAHMDASMSLTKIDCHVVQSPISQSPLPTSSLTNSTSEVQILEQGIQPFDGTTVHSEDNAIEADNGKLITAEKASNDSATWGSSDLGSGVTNKVSGSHCGSISNEAVESSFPVASSERAAVSEIDDIVHHDMTKGANHGTSQREAALMKFRLKRKDRCYEKKVRYQSRKRLAEQRPRVKGQFVRQPHIETHLVEVPK